MLFEYFRFIDFFFDIAIFTLFLNFCHVRGKFIRLEDKMDVKTILDTSLKILRIQQEKNKH